MKFQWNFMKFQWPKFHKVSQSFQNPKIWLFEISNDLKLNMKFHWNFNRKLTWNFIEISIVNYRHFVKLWIIILAALPLKIRQKPLVVHKSYMSKFVIICAWKGCCVLYSGRDPFSIFAKALYRRIQPEQPPSNLKIPLNQEGGCLWWPFSIFLKV